MIIPKEFKEIYLETIDSFKEYIHETKFDLYSFIKSRVDYLIDLIVTIILFNYIIPITDKMYLGGYTSTSTANFFDRHFWTGFILLMLYLTGRSLVKEFIILKKPLKTQFKLKDFVVNISLVVSISFLICLIFKDFGKDLSLYVNSFYTWDKTTEVFIIKKIREDRVKLIHHDFGKLSRRQYVDFIDEHRNSKGQTSIYKLENNDTIQVIFNKGFLEELYLK